MTGQIVLGIGLLVVWVLSSPLFTNFKPDLSRYGFSLGFDFFGFNGMAEPLAPCPPYTLDDHSSNELSPPDKEEDLHMMLRREEVLLRPNLERSFFGTFKWIICGLGRLLIRIFIEIAKFFWCAVVSAVQSCIRESHWIFYLYDVVCSVIKQSRHPQKLLYYSYRMNRIYDYVWGMAVTYSKPYIGSFYIPYAGARLRYLVSKYLWKVLTWIKSKMVKKLPPGNIRHVLKSFRAMSSYSVTFYGVLFTLYTWDLVCYFTHKYDRMMEIYRNPDPGKFRELYPFADMACFVWAWLAPCVHVVSAEFHWVLGLRFPYPFVLLPCFMFLYSSLQELIGYGIRKLAQNPSLLLDLL